MGIASPGRLVPPPRPRPAGQEAARPCVPAANGQECHVDPLPGRATADREEAGVTGERLALGSRYERRPRSGPGRGSGLVLRLSDGALDIAQALLGAALDLPTLAADLLLLAPGHLAAPFLDFAPGLAQRAFDVLIGHGNVPSAVLPLVVRTPHTMEASPGARASGVPAAHASLSSRPNHVMTVRHGAW